jgi:phage baseplate assembly protein W
MADPADVIPQFDLPLRLDGTDLATVEQDSPQDVVNSVTIILRTMLGEHPVLDDFGIADPTFSQGGVDVEALRAQIERWEPRAELVFEENPDLLSELVASIRINVTPLEI